MCDTCGCNREEPFQVHSPRFHTHRDEEGRAHVHAHFHAGEPAGETRTIEPNRSVFAANDRIAERNRGYFRGKGVRAINLLSSPGAGKTALLERTIKDRSDCARIAVIVGDLETENDADRLRAAGAEAVQITTGTLCHLDAAMIARAADSLELENYDLLFIENVGNLVCPASFDLGEALRVVLFSVPEGEDKPLKYPPMFKSADLILLTKTDLVGAAGFDRERALENLRVIAPQTRVIELSSRDGIGMDDWYAFLDEESSARATPALSSAP